MRIFKRKGSPQWWASYTDQDGKRHRRSTGTADRKLANALAAKWVEEDFMERHFGKMPEVPFPEAFLRYAEQRKADNPKTFAAEAKYRLKSIHNRFKDFYLSEITAGVIQDFVDERSHNVKRDTVKRDVTTLKAILNKAHREGFLDRMPVFPRFRREKARTRWLTPGEEDRLVASAAKHLRPLIRFAVDTGGRRGELLSLDWRHVDMVYKRVTFTDTKNGEDRTLRLCDRALATLAAIGPKDSGPVFTFRGKGMKEITNGFQTARRKAGLPEVRFHDLRHTFASRLVQGGVPLYEVMHLTGHKSLEMVQRYSHLASDYQERAMNVLNARGHKIGTIPQVGAVKYAG